jgi:RNA polymerase sigma-70 factor (ECF subfamily)
LLRRLAAGDSDAFWALWHSYRARLFQICYAQMGRHQEDAEDALSDVMHRAREFLPREAGKVRSLGAWLRRLTLNVCIDLHRRRRTRSAEEYLPGMEAASDRTLQFPCPASQFMAAEVRGLVTTAIESLPERLRAAARLFFLEEAPYSAIAETLSIAEPNARKRIQEARGILQEMLDVQFPERRAARSVDSLASRIHNSPKVADQRQRLDAAFGTRKVPLAKQATLPEEF